MFYKGLYMYSENMYSGASRQSYHLFERWTVNYLSYTATVLPMNEAGTNDTKQRSSPFTSYFRSD